MTKAAVAAVLSLCACGGRAPGPHPDERGKITHWILSETSSTRAACSDSAAWAEAIPEEPSYTPGIAWYVIYKVSADGTTALVQDCEQENIRSCQDTTLVLQVEGHVLRFGGQDNLQTQTSCVARRSYLFELDDRGDEAAVEERAEFSLQGDTDACAQAQQAIKAQSPNGEGIDGCVATVSLRMIFWDVL